MAKVIVSLPDELLERLDVEARRRGITRSDLLQIAARREVGDVVAPRADLIGRFDRLATGWDGPVDVVSELRADRRRVVGS